MFKRLVEGQTVIAKYKNSNKTGEFKLNIPMIFITNQVDIFGIGQDQPSPFNVDLNDEMFNSLKSDFGVQELIEQEDDDHLRKGLKERIHIIHASKSVFDRYNQLLDEFTTSHLRSIIKISTEPNEMNQDSFLNV